MDNRTAILCSFALGVAAFSTTACISNQQSRFQNYFLPPMPRTAPVPLQLEEAPSLATNVYLQELPALAPPVAAPRRPRGDMLVQQAGQVFDSGRRLYRSGDVAGARREFDHAVDLMLEASDQNLIDRPDFEKKLDEMIDSIHRIDLAGMGASANAEPEQFVQTPLEDILQLTFPVDPKLKDKVREQVSATVSDLPLMVTDAVLGYLHFFDTRGRNTMLAGIERAGRYRPMIQRILDEEGIPEELIHLAQAESGFMPRAMSHKAAGGMWQFLTWRGHEYGLAQTRFSDDRLDPERATRAAARHLHDLYNEFGDWYLALAAYNCGPVVVEKAVERTGYADFWELRNRGVLPVETTNYVPIILAMTIMEKNPAAYRLEGVRVDPPLEYDTIEVSTSTSLALIADMADSPLPEIQALNPAILKGLTPPGYALHVPKGTGDQLMASLQMIPPEHRNAWRIHRVLSGETLASIVKKYHLPANSLLAANKLLKPEVREGDRLIVPVGGFSGAPVNLPASSPSGAKRRSEPAVRTVASTTDGVPNRNPKAHSSGSLMARSAAQ
jgi:membrane-bound lytic murein transglycosylase D